MMNSLGSILSSKNQPTPLMRGVNAALTIEAANNALVEIFGAAIGEHATAAYLKDEVLCIACLSSTAAQEIKLHEQDLLKRISDKIPAVTIKKVSYIS